MLCTKQTHPILFDSLRLAGYLQPIAGVMIHDKAIILDGRCGPERSILWNTLQNVTVPMHNNRADYVIEIFPPYALITAEHAGIKAKWSIVIHPQDAERLGFTDVHETNGI